MHFIRSLCMELMDFSNQYVYKMLIVEFKGRKYVIEEPGNLAHV